MALLQGAAVRTLPQCFQSRDDATTISNSRVTLSSAFLAPPLTAAAAAPHAPSPAPRAPLRITCKESRIGKMPIPVPKGVTLTLDGQKLVTKGPQGELSHTYPAEISLVVENGVLKVTRAAETRRARELHGLCRTLASNMVVGVASGFEKKLQLIGVGYRAAVDKAELVLNLGYSHQVRVAIPKDIKVKVEENTKITINGRDKCQVGDFAANVRAWRPPEPYKGKGVKYVDEVIRRKEGKVGKKK